MENCPVHNVPFKQVPAGVSKTTGKPYSAFMACPERGCREKPQQQGGWTAVREQVAARVAPEKAVMTKADWEAKDARTNSSILLQVAFKAAVEMAVSGGHIKPDQIPAQTLSFHSWLLSQTEGRKPAAPFISDADVAAANQAIAEAKDDKDEEEEVGANLFY